MGRLGSFTFEFLGVDVGFQQASAKVLQAMQHIGRTAEEMSTKLRLGTASTQDLFESLAKDIPGVGQIFEFGRGIRELATGEKAYTEVLKQQTAAQEKHIEVMNDFIAAIKRMQRAREDATTRANFNAGDSPFAFLFGQAVTGGERASEDAREKLKKENEKLLKELDDQKKQIAEKIRQRKEALSGDIGAPVVTSTGTVIPAQSRNVGHDSVLADLEKNSKLIEDKASQLRKAIDDTVAATENLIGRQVFTRVASLVGEKFVGAFDAAGAAVGRFIGRNREVNATTAEMIKNFSALSQSHAGNIGTFQNQQNALSIDLSRGALTPDVFKALSNKSFFDQAARSVGSILQQYAPITETIARLVDSNFGLSNFASRAAAAVGSVFPGKIAASTAHEFRSSTVGLTDLGRRIQEGAASSGGQQATEKYLPTMDKSLRDAAAALEKFLKLNLGTVK